MYHGADGDLVNQYVIFQHGIAENDPASALEWADAVTDPERRIWAIQYVYSFGERMAE
jgi:hypothetical protein